MAIEEISKTTFVSNVLDFGGRKAEGTYAEGRREEKTRREKVFFTDYPDMILFKIFGYVKAFPKTFNTLSQVQ